MQADARPSFGAIGDILLNRSIFNFIFEVEISLDRGHLEA
jgi:hypothetical protein